jgi:hypothetical protein
MRPERARALSCHGTRIVVELANDYAHTYAPFIQAAVREVGHNYRQVAKWLTRERIPAQRAGQWKAQSVKNLMVRYRRLTGRSHPPPLQEVSNASAPLSAPLNVAGNVRFVATSGHPARVFALLALARSRPHRQSP